MTDIYTYIDVYELQYPLREQDLDRNILPCILGFGPNEQRLEYSEL